MQLNHKEYAQNIFRLCAGQLPKNRKNYRLSVHDETPQEGAFGRVDPKPFKGRVINDTDDKAFIVLSADKSRIHVVDRTLATHEPKLDDWVEVTPYARRDFDGKRVDEPKEETRSMPDGTTYTTQTVTLGGNSVRLPVPKPQCPELGELIEQMEAARVDAFRLLPHMLVDAGARDFETVDPMPENIVDTPPEVSFSVCAEKFTGRVRVSYDRGLDSYCVELFQNGEQVQRKFPVWCDELASVLVELIDDGRWLRIVVEPISPAKKPRMARVA
jgi:hypothetical protein